MKLTTTLNRIRDCSPCTSGWETLLTYVGTDYDPDAPINLLAILKSNGSQDMLWCLRATEQDSKPAAVELSARFAESVLSVFEAKYPGDNRPRDAIEAAWVYLRGIGSAADAGVADADAARAARAAAADYAYAAAYAADVAARAARAARSAYPSNMASYAAYAAATYAAYARAGIDQAAIIRSVLTEEN